MRCRALSLLPTVSGDGLRRSCGKVSQEGNSITSSFGTNSIKEVEISVALLPVAETTTSGEFPAFSQPAIAIGWVREGAKNELFFASIFATGCDWASWFSKGPRVTR